MSEISEIRRTKHPLGRRKSRPLPGAPLAGTVDLCAYRSRRAAEHSDCLQIPSSSGLQVMISESGELNWVGHINPLHAAKMLDLLLLLTVLARKAECFGQDTFREKSRKNE